MGDFKKIQILWHWNKGTLCLILWRFLMHGGSSRCRGRLSSVRQVIGKCHACIPRHVGRVWEWGSPVAGGSGPGEFITLWLETMKQRKKKIWEFRIPYAQTPCEKRENAVVRHEIKHSSATCRAEEGKIDHYVHSFVDLMGETKREVN